LWAALGHKTALVDVAWPQVDDSALEADEVEIVVQVNGKVRGRVSVAADADNDSIAALALADENVQRFVADQEVRKTIVVPGRLVNIVV
jgi:leucyl-tRNA synthetase